MPSGAERRPFRARVDVPTRKTVRVAARAGRQMAREGSVGHAPWTNRRKAHEFEWISRERPRGRRTVSPGVCARWLRNKMCCAKALVNRRGLLVWLLGAWLGIAGCATTAPTSAE